MSIDVDRLSREPVFGIEKKSGNTAQQAIDKTNRQSFAEAIATQRVKNAGQISIDLGLGKSIDVGVVLDVFAWVSVKSQTL